MIQMQQLTRRYGELTALDNLTLTIEKGELFGFLGPNGAGKSTTLRILAGLLLPNSGSATLAGYDIQTDARLARQVAGYMPEEPELYEKLNGMEFLCFVGGLYGLSDSEAQKRGLKLLEMLEMKEKAGELIQSYSHGMRQKLSLCSALLHDPQVLLLDEPLSGLDPYSARQVKDLLRQLCTQGKTVFLSTHTLEIAERVCNRVGILKNGHLIAAGTMDDLRAQARSSAHASLEDLFLQLTGGQDMAEMTAMLSI